ncbi:MULTISPECIES: NAD(P)/FAD-dependent oxidoreductase [unclassified Modestobacter]|uniref:NAD(P)/FAD-dependent oxidoreductase n=1 Tax=unclassified Modestobacter TaxID=2643866 RepID=UPI0022AAD2F8|nr:MULTISPECIES: FAD-dependent monooxygenase [unclassified Modestobacter]MCZ2826537.1 tryptophan 7-halogenase [Modestobacter sp. VKM Ac-2981]MCZ2852398.1 tryptophan 7-halogenase [Modestobacter sp. VKM Ac-2982]
MGEQRLTGGPVDLVVVGAGPAGTAAAVTAAVAGLSVVLVEASAVTRERPGETLHPGAEGVLRQLGITREVAASGWLRHPGHWVAWGGPARFVPFGGPPGAPWTGYQAPRRELAELLLGRAAAVGVTVHRDCRALRPTVSPAGRVDGVHTSRGWFPAAWVVDASGGRHWSARALSLPVHRVSRPLVASWGHLAGSWPERAVPHLRADRAGWTWTAPVRPDVHAWVRLDVRQGAGLPGPPPHPGHLQPVTGPHAATVTWRRATVPAVRGLLVAGDAAGLLDPCSGSGVLRALVTGAVAGRAVADTLRGLLPEEAVLDGYRRWLADWFGADVARLDQRYALFPDWSPAHRADSDPLPDRDRPAVRPRTAAAPGGARRGPPAR